MRPLGIFSLWAILLGGASSSAETIVLRTADGRFLRATDGHTLRAEAFIPGEKETFELVSRGERQVAVKAPDGRWLAPDPRDGRTACLTAAWSEPNSWTTFELVSADENRVAFRSLAFGKMLVLDPAASRTATETAKGDSPIFADHASMVPEKSGQSPKLAPAETIELYCPHPLPAILQTAVPTVVNRLADEELSGKQYDKSWRQKTEKFIKVPDPTLKYPLRLKRQQVLAVVEESRVQAQLDGKTDLRIPAMLFLSGRTESQRGLILLAVEARVPVRGRVQYEMLNVARGSTNYFTTIHLSAAAEIPVRESGGDVTFSPPRVRKLDVSLSGLKLSNDVLHAARGPIERTINGELRRNEARIRQQANKSLEKAISSREVRIPLLGFLKLL
jgi:hypothetical protein